MVEWFKAMSHFYHPTLHTHQNFSVVEKALGNGRIQGETHHTVVLLVQYVSFGIRRHPQTLTHRWSSSDLLILGCISVPPHTSSMCLFVKLFHVHFVTWCIQRFKRLSRWQLQVEVNTEVRIDSTWFNLNQQTLLLCHGWINRILWMFVLCPVLSMNHHCVPVVVRQLWPSPFKVFALSGGAEAKAEEQREAGVSWRTAAGFLHVL